MVSPTEHARAMLVVYELGSIQRLVPPFVRCLLLCLLLLKILLKILKSAKKSRKAIITSVLFVPEDGTK